MRRRLRGAGMGAIVFGALMLVPTAAHAGFIADLAVTKSDSVDPATVGSPFDYTIEVTNQGPDVAPDVVVTDEVPNELDIVSATPSQGTCDVQPARTVTCELGTIASGDTATVTIRVTPRRDGTITNTASATAAALDQETANNQDSEQTVIVGDAGGGGGGAQGPQCAGRNATIVGTSGDDEITGTTDRDVIVANGGNDRILGLGGKDVICAGGGNDKVRAHGRGDLVKGGGGSDRIRGGGGGDRLRGGAGRDRLNGGGGADRLTGGGGNDRCIGGPGEDRKRRC